MVESEAIQLQGMGEKIGAHPKPSEQQLLWTPVPHPSVRWIKQLHLSCRSFATRAGEGSQCLLLLQSQPGRAREAPPGSCLPWYFQFSLLFQLSPSEALHSWQVSVKENPPVLSLSHKLFIFNPLWGAFPRLQAHRLLIYLQLKLSESGC